MDMTDFLNQPVFPNDPPAYHKEEKNKTSVELKVVKDNLQKSKDKIQKLENIISEQSLKLHVFAEENTKLKTFKDV